MEEFVRSVFQKADLSILTKRMVRHQYKVYIGKDSLDDTEKNKLNKIVYRLLKEINVDEILKQSKNTGVDDKTAECSRSKKATKDGLRLIRSKNNCTAADPLKEKGNVIEEASKQPEISPNLSQNENNESYLNKYADDTFVISKKFKSKPKNNKKVLSSATRLKCDKSVYCHTISLDLLTPSKDRKKSEQESSPKIRNASESEQNEIKFSPRETRTPSKSCQQKTEILQKETGKGEAKVYDKLTDEAENSPLSASKDKGKIDRANKKSPRLNVSEVLDEVMKSDIENNNESSEDESSATEDDIKLISSDSGSDEEKNWKPFSPYKPKNKKSAKNRNSKWCSSGSDDKSDSEIESLSKNEDEECSPIKVRKKKLGQSVILSTDDDPSPEKGQRSRKSPRKKTNQHKVEKNNSESGKDSVSDSDEEYTLPKKSQNRNKKKKDKVFKKGKLSGKSPEKTTNKNSKRKTNNFNSDQDSCSSESDSDEEYSPGKKTQNSKPKRKDDSYKKSKRTGKTKISQKTAVINVSSSSKKLLCSSDSDSDLDQIKKRRKLSVIDKSRNSRSLKRKAVMSSDESHDSDCKMSDSENENVPKKRKTSSTRKSGPKTNTSRKGYLSSDKELQESSEEDVLPLKPGNSLKSAETKINKEGKRGSKDASRQSSDSSPSSSDSEEEMSLAKLRTSSNNSRNKASEKRLSSEQSEGGTSGSGSSSDSDEELPLSIVQKSSNKESKANEKRLSSEHHDGETSGSGSSSDSDEELPLSNIQKSSHSKSKKSKKKSPANDEESTHVKNLRKICRAAGIFVNAKKDFLSCKTNNQKVKKLKQILEEAGMKGRPTMKKTIKLRLKKEAAELSKENIIQEDKGRPKRKVNSLFSRNAASPKQVCTPPRKAFCRLKDIVDSEDSD